MNQFNESMMRLGATATYDSSKLSKSTLISSASHIRTLKRNDIPINEQSLTINTTEMLDKLRNGKGELLDDLYKRQIGMTIKRMYPDININLDKYSRNRSQSRKYTTRNTSEEFNLSLKLIIDHASLVIKQSYELKTIESLGIYDACIAVLLTVSTSLRINELNQLKVRHIEKIKASEPLDIVSKGSRRVRSIAPNSILLGVLNAIQIQRPKVFANLELKTDDMATRKQKQRYSDGYLLINSVGNMRLKLKEISAALGIKTQTLGFNSFRKYITSVLVENGAHYIAQSMNNHSSLNTTLNHYNVVAPQAVQKTFNDLMDSIKPVSGTAEDVKSDMKRRIEAQQNLIPQVAAKLSKLPTDLPSVFLTPENTIQFK